MNDWLQLSLPASNKVVDAWSDALTEAGAVAITLEEDKSQPIYQQANEQVKLWDNMLLIALFNPGTNPLQIIKQVSKAIGPAALSQLTWKKIVDQDWVLKWQENLKPMLFANKLWICPTWCEVPDPHAINIFLDPEMAFGTGSHQTTALCLEWIAQSLPDNCTMIDYGCGSGILAIAAAKLGASKVYAVDIDPTALEVTRSNAEKNQIDLQSMEICLANQLPQIKADVLVANILAQPLLQLAPLFAQLLKPQGQIVLSGILVEQAAKVQNCYAEFFQDFLCVEQDEWVRISAILS